MREVRVESLQNLEYIGGEARLFVESEGVEIVFTREAWESLVDRVASGGLVAPSKEEVSGVSEIRDSLVSMARESGFTTVMEDVKAGGSGLSYDLVLKSSDLYAVTTGYVFSDSELEASLAGEFRAALSEDDFVEQVYIVCPVAGEDALAEGDDDLRVVSVRGGKSTVSRFEMAPELWRTLAEGLGWRDVETFVGEGTATGNAHKRQEV